MATRTILLTGANGFVGSHLVDRLVAQGNEVRCLVRAASDARSLKGKGGLLVEGDVTVLPSVKAAMKGVELVFHLAGVRRGATREDFMRVNAEGTRVVAEAMVEAGARRLVLCGSLAASGPTNGGLPKVEEDPFAPAEWYGESKAEAERLAFTYADRLEVTCSRPARILGPRDRENLTFFKLASRGVVLRILGPPREFSFVDVDDVVDHLLLCAERPEAVGQAFFCTSSETMSVEQLMGSIADLAGVPRRTVPVPVPLFKAVGAAADVISTATKRKLPVNRKLVRQVLSGWTCSPEKSARVLGFRAQRSVRASLEASLSSYRELGWL